MVNLDSPHIDRVFRALADATRREMLARLSSGKLSVSELGRPHQMSLVAASKHVRVLEEAGLIESRKEGRTRTCVINPAAFATARQVLDYYQGFWERNLDSLDAFLQAKESTP